MDMAKKIELGLILEGEDARDFHLHSDDPKYPPQGMKMLKRAYELSRSRGEGSKGR